MSARGSKESNLSKYRVKKRGCFWIEGRVRDLDKVEVDIGVL